MVDAGQERAEHLSVADDVERMVALHGADTIAAVIVEPVPGSTAVLPPPQNYLQRLRQACDKHGILLIFDEVITGFGRLGTPFAANFFGVTPDLMTTAKGITNGTIPCGAVFASRKVHDGLMVGPENAMELFHGYTYSAHPVSAAVALEVLRLYEDGLLENGIKAGARLMAGLEGLSDHPLVGDVRGRGMLAAIELVVDKKKKTPLPASAMPARRVFDRAWDNGLIIRAFANGVLGYAPPLCCTDSDIDAIIERTRRTLDQTLDDPDVRQALA